MRERNYRDRTGERLLAAVCVLVLVCSAATVGVAGSVSEPTPDQFGAGESATEPPAYLPGGEGLLPAPTAAAYESSVRTTAGQVDPDEVLSDEQQAAIEEGVRQGARLARERGTEVEANRITAAIDAALVAATQWQDASPEKMRGATAGVTHGTFIQQQEANVSQRQSIIRGAVAGALSQSQSASVTQLQSAGYGAAHGTLAQYQRATVRQLQFAATGAAAGATAGAAQESITAVGKIQEAAQGAAFGALEDGAFDPEDIFYASSGGAHGALRNAQTANVKQVQVAAIGGTKGALVQKQSVTVEQRQYAARGGAAGALRQTQRVTIKQIQVAARGAAAGAVRKVVQRQEVRVEQVQFAAQGAAAGALSQRQTVSVAQIQFAAHGASGGAIHQYQSATVEQMQSAAFGAASGAVRQRQRISVTQVQYAAEGAASGALIQTQEVTIEQIQFAASGGAYGVLVQRQSVSTEQAQAAARGAAEGALSEVVQRQEVRVEQIQAAAIGAAKGVLTQRQRISVTQVQASARGAAGGALRQVQRVTVRQIQRAAQGAASGAASAAVQRQEITVEQIQAAAGGAAEGSLTQIQRVSVTQIQYAASGAARGALIQRQEVTIEQIQAASFGAANGGVQIQQVSIVQVQTVTQSAASGALSQSQRVSVTQIQGAASGTSRAVLSQRQEISISQLQYLTWKSAARSAFTAAESGIEIETEVAVLAENTTRDRVEDPEPRPTASVSLRPQTGAGVNLTVESVNLSEGGFVTIRDESYDDGDILGSIIGTSDYFEPGTYEDVIVQLDEPLTSNATLWAVVHRDTDGNQEFTFPETNGIEDDAYVDDEGAVGDSAPVGLETAAGPVTANVTVTDHTSNGTTVRIADANLSQGGFLAIHDDTLDTENLADSLIATTEYREPGEVGNVTVPLDDPLTESGSVFVVPYRDTNGNEIFDFTATNGEQDTPYTEQGEPVIQEARISIAAETVNATLSVVNQAGDGTTLAVENASAPTNYTLAVDSSNVTNNETSPLAENEVFSGNLTLDPPFAENTTVTVTVRDAETGSQLAAKTVNYTVENVSEPPANATLDVSNQTGDGTTLSVENATSNTPFRLSVTADNETLNETAVFEANESFAGTLTLDPPLEANTKLTALVTDTETGDQLATAPVNYTVTAPPAEPTANLSVVDQSGNGTTLAVESASASVEYYLQASANNETRNRTRAFEASEPFSGRLTLDSPLDENSSVSVGVYNNETGEELNATTINYTAVAANVTEPSPSVAIENQTSNGTTVTVAAATLPEGGFVTLHNESVQQGAVVESVVGVSDYLDPGSYENVTVNLDEQLTKNETLIAMPHRDTNDNQTYEFVTSGGAVDGPYEADDEAVTDDALVSVPPERMADDGENITANATLSVVDQSGNGSTLTVDNATATVPFAVGVSVDNETLNETGVFEANDTFSGNLSLDPSLDENEKLSVAILDEAGDELTTTDVVYAVEVAAEPSPPSATLVVDNQTGDGTNLTVDTATASVPFVVTASANEELSNETREFAANTTFVGNLTLVPALESNATVTVSVRNVATAEALLTENISYIVRTTEPTQSPTATPELFPNETGTPSVAETPTETESLTETPTETATPTTTETPSETESPTETAEPTPSETVTPTPTATPELFPGENETPNVVETPSETETPTAETPTAPETPTATATASPTATATETPTPEPEPAATLVVQNQTRDGTRLAVARASADQSYYLAVDDGTQRLSRTSAFPAGETFSGELTLDPVVGRNNTLTVGVYDSATDEQVNTTTVNYMVAITQETFTGLSQYENVANARAAGYVDTHRFATDQNSATGIRFVNSAVLDGNVDPRQPAILLYTLDQAGEYELVGVEWAVPSAASPEPPALFGEAFAGPVPGHTPEIPSHYELYGWLFRDNPDGTFAESNPALASPSLLQASDQTTNGIVVSVDSAVFSDNYYIEVRSSDGQLLGRSATLSGDVSNFAVALDQPLPGTTTVTIAPHHADSGAEIAEPVLQQNVTVTVEPSTPSATTTPTETAESAETSTTPAQTAEPTETETPTPTSSETTPTPTSGAEPTRISLLP